MHRILADGQSDLKLSDLLETWKKFNYNQFSLVPSQVQEPEIPGLKLAPFD